jgi:hypothetical protein
VLAVATAVNNANVGADGTQQALLDGFQAAIVVSVIVAALGAILTSIRFGSRAVAADETLAGVEPLEAEVEAEAA